MNNPRSFPLSVVLSALTGKLFVRPEDGGLGAVDTFIHFVENDGQYSAVYVRALLPQFRAELVRQQPSLAMLDASHVTSDNGATWLAEQEARFGKTLSFEARDLPYDFRAISDH